MPTDPVSATQQPSRRGLVIALHCSGSGASQWRRLGEELGGDYELVAPEHYGCESIGAWTGEHTFTLADEAARTLALIDRCDRPVHLVGHSYGGGLALHIALKRPNRIASLTHGLRLAVRQPRKNLAGTAGGGRRDRAGWRRHRASLQPGWGRARP